MVGTLITVGDESVRMADEEDTTWMVLQLAAVFVVALVAIQGFEYLRTAVAEGTVAVETVAFVVALGIGTLVAWHLFGARLRG